MQEAAGETEGVKEGYGKEVAEVKPSSSEREVRSRTNAWRRLQKKGRDQGRSCMEG